MPDDEGDDENLEGELDKYCWVLSKFGDCESKLALLLDICGFKVSVCGGCWIIIILGEVAGDNEDGRDEEASEDDNERDEEASCWLAGIILALRLLSPIICGRFDLTQLLCWLFIDADLDNEFGE